MRLAGMLCLLFSIAVSAADPGKVVRKTFKFADAARTYFLYEPDKAPDGKRPLIITLHGSGGDARMLVDNWKDIASREGVVVMGPQSFEGKGWELIGDSPEFFQALVDTAVRDYNVDDRRVYLFGFSAGGHFALSLAVLEPEYFAAAAVYAGALMPNLNDVAAASERRIPIVLVGGKQDTVVAPPYLEDTRARLNARGWDVQLHWVDNGHNYRQLPKDINTPAWELFKKSRLETDPVFKRYRFR
jgi:poly(3-hydroxybutyrate) depolymerase